jgi:hypothetical protein
LRLRRCGGTWSQGRPCLVVALLPSPRASACAASRMTVVLCLQGQPLRLQQQQRRVRGASSQADVFIALSGVLTTSISQGLCRRPRPVRHLSVSVRGREQLRCNLCPSLGLLLSREMLWWSSLLCLGALCVPETACAHNCCHTGAAEHFGGRLGVQRRAFQCRGGRLCANCALGAPIGAAAHYLCGPQLGAGW